MAPGDIFGVRRVCFGYGPQTAERPEEFVAGFRVEESPMLWAMAPTADGRFTHPRSPNLAADHDPAWNLASPDRQWWVLAELDGFLLPGDIGDVRLAWTMPETDSATLALGLGRGDEWSWDEFHAPDLAEALAASSRLYVSDMDVYGSQLRLMRRLRNVFVEHATRTGRLQPGDGAPMPVPSVRDYQRRRSPPRSDWLNVFDRRHAAALSWSTNEVEKHVAAQRPFTERGQRRLQHGIDVVTIAQAVVPGALSGLGMIPAIAAVQSFVQGAPELGLFFTATTVLAGLVSYGAHRAATDGLRLLRTRLGRSLGMPGPDTPTDHPAVLRKAGYVPPPGGRSEAQHTTAAVARFRRF